MLRQISAIVLELGRLRGNLGLRSGVGYSISIQSSRLARHIAPCDAVSCVSSVSPVNRIAGGQES